VGIWARLAARLIRWIRYGAIATVIDFTQGENSMVLCACSVTAQPLPNRAVAGEKGIAAMTVT
jgi:hypothetical protein